MNRVFKLNDILFLCIECLDLSIVYDLNFNGQIRLAARVTVDNYNNTLLINVPNGAKSTLHSEIVKFISPVVKDITLISDLVENIS